MIRLLNALALVALIASATWAYSVKYETILVAEKLKRHEAELQRERDAVVVLQAEWQMLNRAPRLQALAKPEVGMAIVSARQIARPQDIPQLMTSSSDKIDSLLTGTISPPDAPRKTNRTATPLPMTPRPASQAGKSVTPSANSSTRAGLILSKSASARPLAGRVTGDPVKLVPPARLGQVRSAPDAQPASNPLTGFLKRLIQ
jgi:hypothetical protein